MQNREIDVRMKKCWWSPFVLMADVVLQVDESLPFLAFQKRSCQCNFSQIFKGRQIILEPCRNLKYPIRCFLWWHKKLPGAIWTQTYSEPLQACKMECFCVNSEWLKVVNWLCKNTLSQMSEGIMNMPLLKNKAGVRCAKRTLDAAT